MAHLEQRVTAQAFSSTSQYSQLQELPMAGSTADSAGETCRVKLDPPLQTDYHTDLRIAEPAGQ